MEFLDPGDVYLAASQALKQNITSCMADAERDYVAESVVEEFSDHTPPASGAELQERLGDLLLSMQPAEGLAWTSDDVADVCGSLWQLLTRAAEEAEREAGAAQEQGGCLLCEREMPLTRHHLIPRSVWPRYKRRGIAQADLAATIAICRQCHSAVHKFADERTLAESYASLEKLQGVEELQRFVKYIRSQRVYSRDDIMNKNFRYAR